MCQQQNPTMHSLKYAKQRQNAISKVPDHKCNIKYNTQKAECVNLLATDFFPNFSTPVFKM